MRVKKLESFGHEGSQGQGEFYDPALKDNIVGRKQTRLDLWEEHFKDPIIALDKALKCQANPHSGCPLAQSSCGKARELRLGGLRHFAKEVGKTFLRRRLA